MADAPQIKLLLPSLLGSVKGGGGEGREPWTVLIGSTLRKTADMAGVCSFIRIIQIEHEKGLESLVHSGGEILYILWLRFLTCGQVPHVARSTHWDRWGILVPPFLQFGPAHRCASRRAEANRGKERRKRPLDSGFPTMAL